MIHDRSPRREKAFVAVNCAAIPASLIEAELFGHERGAFTGAFKRRAGRFKAADGGTLFLDEIGEMPAELQPKMLRVLQEGTFEPIGTNTSVHVDVRVISATNRDLKAGVADGDLPQGSLLPHPGVRPAHCRPCASGAGDLPLLVGQFLSEFTPPGDGCRCCRRRPGRRWSTTRFPGNIRELKHAIQHATILARGSDIDLHHLPDDVRGDVGTPACPSRCGRWRWRSSNTSGSTLPAPCNMAEGERKRAAEMLGISRKSLWKKMSKYGLR